jgi:hypothetical protein
LKIGVQQKKDKEYTVYERIYIKKDSFEKLKSSLLPLMRNLMLYKINE